MKKLLVVLYVMVFFFGITGIANATLWDRGGGLIYDDVLDITWLQDANYAMSSGYDSDGEMGWVPAKAWASQLVYGGYDDWRLPQTGPVNVIDGYNNDWSYDGSTDHGYNISAPGTVYQYSTASEMAYMYYVNLGNPGRWDIGGSCRPDYEEGITWGLINTEPFINLLTFYYWSGTASVDDLNKARGFDFWDGSQFESLKDSNVYSWAVRDGDSAPVPVPATILLLGSGLAGLGILRKKISSRHG